MDACRDKDKISVEMIDEAGGPGTPVSLTLLGQLYGEERLLRFARAYQDATTFHLQHPKLGV